MRFSSVLCTQGHCRQLRPQQNPIAVYLTCMASKLKGSLLRPRHGPISPTSSLSQGCQPRTGAGPFPYRSATSRLQCGHSQLSALKSRVAKNATKGFWKETWWHAFPQGHLEDASQQTLKAAIERKLGLQEQDRGSGPGAPSQPGPALPRCPLAAETQDSPSALPPPASAWAWLPGTVKCLFLQEASLDSPEPTANSFLRSPQPRT